MVDAIGGVNMSNGQAMWLLNVIKPWQIPIYGLLGSAFATFSVIAEEGFENYLLLVGAAWAMIVLPVNLLLLYPPLILFYVFYKGMRGRAAVCIICSVLSFLAGLVSLQTIMSV